MIVHRDYHLSSDSIVKIFDTKIEFFNPGRLPNSITVDDLLTNNYRSTPRNKFLADFFKDLGLIEKYGSGIQRIINYFKEEHLPAPVFQNISDGFMVTVYSGSYAELGDKLGDRLGDKLGDNQRLILESLKNNPFISLSQLSKSIGISQTAIEKNISKLKEIGLIKRIGPAKGGHWEVLN
jgi:ATP-dependent DNA helicase RecG